jgi:hypothetical protein
MQVTAKRLVVILGVVVILAAAATWIVHDVSLRRNGAVGIFTAPQIYLFISSVVVSLCLWFVQAFLKVRRKKLTTRITLKQGLKLVREWLESAKRHDPIQFVYDSKDPGSAIDFRAHRGLLWGIRLAVARGCRVQFILAGKPGTFSRANPLFNYGGDFESFKKTSQFRQFRLHEKCPADATREEFEEVMHRYMDRVGIEYDDWELDLWELLAEHAEHVDMFFFRVGNKAVLVKLNPAGAPTVSETSDPHVITILDGRFRQFLAVSKKLPKRSIPGDQNVLAG